MNEAAPSSASRTGPMSLGRTMRGSVSCFIEGSSAAAPQAA
jgi:hypothetical protein